MSSVPPTPPKRRAALAGHRRVGLLSLAFAMIGAGWVSSVVLPGLRKAGTNTNGVVAGAFGTPGGAGRATTASPAPADPLRNATQGDSETHLTEASFVAAPTGIALQALLAAARFSASASPAITGVVTYSGTGTPKPFWQVVGRIVGAAPAPGVQIAQGFDQYRILPRNIVVRRGELESYLPPVDVAVVPLGEARVTYRMAGYVSLAPSEKDAPIPLALLETRVPGAVPAFRVLRIGGIVSRKSAQETATEINAAANVDIAPVVETITADALILRGGGNKTLRVPFGTTGVPDTFGTPYARATETDTIERYKP